MFERVREDLKFFPFTDARTIRYTVESLRRCRKMSNDSTELRNIDIAISCLLWLSLCMAASSQRRRCMAELAEHLYMQCCSVRKPSERVWTSTFLANQASYDPIDDVSKFHAIEREARLESKLDELVAADPEPWSYLIVTVYTTLDGAIQRADYEDMKREVDLHLTNPVSSITSRNTKLRIGVAYAKLLYKTDVPKQDRQKWWRHLIAITSGGDWGVTRRLWRNARATGCTFVLPPQDSPRIAWLIATYQSSEPTSIDDLQALLAHETLDQALRDWIAFHLTALIFRRYEERGGHADLDIAYSNMVWLRPATVIFEFNYVHHIVTQADVSGLTTRIMQAMGRVREAALPSMRHYDERSAPIKVEDETASQFISLPHASHPPHMRNHLALQSTPSESPDPPRWHTPSESPDTSSRWHTPGSSVPPNSNSWRASSYASSRPSDFSHDTFGDRPTYYTPEPMLDEVDPGLMNVDERGEGSTERAERGLGVVRDWQGRSDEETFASIFIVKTDIEPENVVELT